MGLLCYDNPVVKLKQYYKPNNVPDLNRFGTSTETDSREMLPFQLDIRVDVSERFCV
jgi:hypothetical protein